MVKMRFCTILALSGVMIAGGCAPPDRIAREPSYVPVPPPRPAPRMVAPSSAAYVAAAASIDLFQIQSSELALRRSSNAAIREFASMMIAAHRGTGAQLSFAGRRLNLLPSAKLQPAHQAMLNELTASANFDAAYRRQQAEVHRAALALHSSYAARGRSPTLRPVAGAMLPIIQRHIRMLRYL